MPTDNTGTVITTLTAVGDSVVMRCHQRQRRPHHQIVGRLTLVGILHGCLQHHTNYDENIAWGHRTNQKLSEAA